MELEEWKTIEEFPNYIVSNTGRIRNQKFDREMKLRLNRGGYPTVGLTNNSIQYSVSVHSCVAKAFCDGYKSGVEVNHIDSNRSNNNFINLEWVTRSENALHSFRTGLRRPMGRPIKILETGEIFKTATEAAQHVDGNYIGVLRAARKQRITHKGFHYEYADLGEKLMGFDLLMDHQKDVLPFLSNGKILYGDTGSGKSMVAVAYYAKEEAPLGSHVYVITTAKKRGSADWFREFARFGIGTEENATLGGVLTVDSWNNLHKYIDIEDAFFIFDEQRLVGGGSWVKSFLKISKKNRWIMLSATPGDNWLDYAPVFVANGFYKNIGEFKQAHVLYEPFLKFPKIKGYLNETKLELLRNEVLVEMPFLRESKRILNWMDVGYDEVALRKIYKERWNIYDDCPIKDVSEMFRLMRRCVNSDPSRLEQIRYLLKPHPKLIIFYNFNYELDILRTLRDEIEVAEYNGHIKNDIPEGDEWVYLVQYVAGAEAWNCITTDAMCLYSLTYSYKNFEQAQGRIDRMNSTFDKFYYYLLISHSIIDHAIRDSLRSKRNFNEREFMLQINNFGKFGEDNSDNLDLCQI